MREAAGWIFWSALFLAAAMDMREQRIPDWISAAAALAGALAALGGSGPALTGRLCGALCVSGPLLFAACLRLGCVGGGDIKLTAACGFYLGWRAMSASFCAAVLLAGVYSVCLLLRKGKGQGTQFAFGPFLALGVLITHLSVL